MLEKKKKLVQENNMIMIRSSISQSLVFKMVPIPEMTRKPAVFKFVRFEEAFQNVPFSYKD